MDTIDNSADVIDSRDVIRRLDELESERTDLADPLTEARDAFVAKVGKSYDEASAEEIDEKEAFEEEQAYLRAQEALTEWDAPSDSRKKTHVPIPPIKRSL